MHYNQVPFPPPPPEQHQIFIEEGLNSPLRIDQPGFPTVLQSNPKAYPMQPVEIEEEPAYDEDLYNLEYLQRPCRTRPFSDLDSRKDFIRNVYGLLMLKLLTIFMLISAFIFEPNLKGTMQNNILVLWISFPIFFVFYFLLVCFEYLRRKKPLNIAVFVIFLLTKAYLLGAISSYYDIEIIFFAVGIAATACFTITLTTLSSKMNSTTCIGMTMPTLAIILVFGFVTIWTRDKTRILTMFYSGTAALVFLLYLFMDTQALMSGEFIKIKEDEYVFTVLTLYTDIVLIHRIVQKLLKFHK